MATEDVVTGDIVTCTYWSMDEMGDAAERRQHMGPGRHGFTVGEHFAGASDAEIYRMSHQGWTEQLDEALDIAESAVELCERNHEVLKVTEPVYDVSGDSVDIGRYLEGEPECMMDYPLQVTSSAGRVITLCASVAYSAAIDHEVITRRGQVITALALALSRMGHAVELWIDSSWSRCGKKCVIRTMVKGADDTLDPARIMFAYAHPGVCRVLSFAIENGIPADFRKAIGVGIGYGLPTSPVEDMPEGTIYLPAVRSSYNRPDAHQELRKLLGEIGLLAE